MATREDQAVRYWPTADAYAVHLDRGPCGHILCAHASQCALQAVGT